MATVVTENGKQRPRHGRRAIGTALSRCVSRVGGLKPSTSVPLERHCDVDDCAVILLKCRCAFEGLV